MGTSKSAWNWVLAAMRKFGLSFLLVGWNVLASGYFTAMGLSRFALPISLGRGCVLLLASLAVTAFLIGGEALWFATALSEGLCLLMTAAFFLRYARSED